MTLAKLHAAGRGEGKADDDLIKIVVPSLKLIWLWIPKNAGGSISRSLLKAHGEDAIPCDLSLEQLWRLNPAMEQFRIVAFKRNPYTRVVSCWLNKVMYAHPANEGFFKRYRNLRQGMSFFQFARWLNTEEGSDAQADQHWRSQHLMLQRAEELLSFEDLPEPVTALGIDPRSLPKRNTSEEMAETTGVDNRPLTDWYDARSFRLITRRYARDLRRLGYSFPGEPPLA